jgi:protein-tyrosine-phosphatase
MEKNKVLFLCTHNAAWSQMAEAFLKKLAGEQSWQNFGKCGIR